MGSFGWFQKELDVMMPNRELRLVRDPHRLGLDLYVVERKVPSAVHAEELECLRLEGEERYQPLFLETVGMIQYDLAPEWRIVHICKASTCDHNPPQMSNHEASCYREPNRDDLRAISRWLFEFASFEASADALKREAEEKQAALDRESMDFYKKEFKSSHVFRQAVFYDAPKTVFSDETQFKQKEDSKLWLPN